MEKTCSKCKQPFECCNEKGGCWCEKLVLTPETLAALKERYENCLCPACLRHYAGEEQVISI